MRIPVAAALFSLLAVAWFYLACVPFFFTVFGAITQWFLAVMMPSPNPFPEVQIFPFDLRIGLVLFGSTLLLLPGIIMLGLRAAFPAPRRPWKTGAFCVGMSFALAGAYFYLSPTVTTEILTLTVPIGAFALATALLSGLLLGLDAIRLPGDPDALRPSLPDSSPVES